jgi:hypothetical protein
VTARYKDEKGSKKTGAWKAKGRIKEMSQWGKKGPDNSRASQIKKKTLNLVLNRMQNHRQVWSKEWNSLSLLLILLFCCCTKNNLRGQRQRQRDQAGSPAHWTRPCNWRLKQTSLAFSYLLLLSILKAT